jgi:hypothetical protein
LENRGVEEVREIKVLTVRWQRLVSPEGRTCDRCAVTEQEVEAAVEVLADVLRPLDIEPSLEVAEIDFGAFASDPGSSNRIWLAGRPLEEWIGAEVGLSRCCSVCGDADCRTVDVDGISFEAIPQQLILKAALIAASTMLDDDSGDTGGGCSCQEAPLR